MTQKEALDIMKTGANVFLTGAAGSGKTYVLREYLKCLRERDIPVGITASTGIAATHMGGVTIHSWAGIGINDSLTKQEIEEIAEKDYVRRKVAAAKVLIIDEISMLHHFRLDLINRVLKKIRNSQAPFGGLQIIVCGDFFQLPPVARMGEPDAQFAYHSEAWKEAQFKVCYLEEQHRQNDPHYLKILNEVRADKVSAETINMLRSRFVSQVPEEIDGQEIESSFEEETILLDDGLNAELNESFQASQEAGMVETSSSKVRPAVGSTRLYSHNMNVDSENDRELGKVSGTMLEYTMNCSGNRKLVETLKKSCLAPEVLRLKKGARVMFVKNNYELGYANGTLGIVEDCGYETITVRTSRGMVNAIREVWMIEENGKVLAELEQYPLRLAWAITIHKSQGMSLDAAHIDLSRTFEKGMGYVALSRVRSLAGLSLVGLNRTALEVHGEALQYNRHFRELSAKQGAEFSVLSGDELKRKQNAFLGPDPSEEEKAVNSKRGKKMKTPKAKKIPTIDQTKELFDSGMSLREVAAKRGLEVDTIINHIDQIKEKDPKWDISFLKDLIPVTKFKKIAMAFHKVGVKEGGLRPLGPVKGILGGAYSYTELKIVRMFL